MQERGAKLPAGLPVKFDRPVAVVGGAPFDPRLVERLVGRGFALVAADGAADDLALSGLTPDLIVGDFDSIADAEAFRGRSRLVHLEEQETTDFEKCLYATEAQLYVGIGMTGRRFDHTLAAIHVSARYGAEKRLVLVEEAEVAAVATGRFAIELDAGTMLSVFPLAEVSFQRSKGLAFPLSGVRLDLGERIGTSNRTTGGKVEIEPVSGSTAPYMVIVPIEAFEAVLAAMAP